MFSIVSTQWRWTVRTSASTALCFVHTSWRVTERCEPTAMTHIKSKCFWLKATLYQLMFFCLVYCEFQWFAADASGREHKSLSKHLCIFIIVKNSEMSCILTSCISIHLHSLTEELANTFPVKRTIDKHRSKYSLGFRIAKNN